MWAQDDHTEVRRTADALGPRRCSASRGEEPGWWSSGPGKGGRTCCRASERMAGTPRERPGSVVGLFHHILGLPPALMGGAGEGRGYPALEHRDGRWHGARGLGTGRRGSVSQRGRGPPREGGRHPCGVFVLGQASTRPCAERCPCTVHQKPLDHPGRRRRLAASSHPRARPGRLGALGLAGRLSGYRV